MPFHLVRKPINEQKKEFNRKELKHGSLIWKWFKKPTLIEDSWIVSLYANRYDTTRKNDHIRIQNKN